MADPRFLSLEEVLYLHSQSLARFGGSAGIRDLGLVESALVSAQNTYWYGHGDSFQIAAAYAFHLAEAQAFIDGNKRTGVAAAITFLALNGIHIPKDDGTLYQALIDTAEKRLDKTGLATVLLRLSDRKN